VRLQAKLSDDVWQVVKDHYGYEETVGGKSIRQYIEENAEIIPFDGGVFVVVGNEFDLFVSPRKRGKWNIRRECTQFLATMAQKYDVAIARINEDNVKSLRLAKFFGFEETNHADGVVTLERKLWEKH
jgi:hypothetical protein